MPFTTKNSMYIVAVVLVTEWSRKTRLCCFYPEYIFSCFFWGYPRVGTTNNKSKPVGVPPAHGEEGRRVLAAVRRLPLGGQNFGLPTGRKSWRWRGCRDQIGWVFQAGQDRSAAAARIGSWSAIFFLGPDGWGPLRCQHLRENEFENPMSLSL